jgi:hypothetical protein
MRTKLAFVVVLAVVGCGKKPDSSGGGGSGSSETKPVEVEKPITCPAGNVVKDGKCIVVITPEKIEAVAQQQTRLDDLAKLLDKIDDASAPIELLNAFRKLDEWKGLTTKFEKLKMVDDVVAKLDDAIKTLRSFKGGLGEASGRLGNLKGELDRLMKDPGVARKLDEVRTLISASVRSAMEPLGAQVYDTIQNALTPLVKQLDDVSSVIELTCATAKLGGAGEKTKELCKQAKLVFAKGQEYLDDFKARPALVYDQITKELEKQLDQLIDEKSKLVLDAAQAKVNDALKLPAAGSGSGSASGSDVKKP